ncbi:hypothetical protein HanPI659440_Chr12g0444431 [Helianthus annuus]|nr:hypothetical protein HanPI659440_Chr12g0444431 [Helianthus annuus]
MFLYVNMFSICSDMFDMFCTHLIMPPIMYGVLLPIMFRICSDTCTHMVMFPISIGLSMLLTMFSVRFCYVLVMSVLTQYLYWFVSVSSQYQS